MADEKKVSQRLVFDLPDRHNQLGMLETNRLVSCECIQGDTAAEISLLWNAYRTGCAGLDPAAYQEVVRTLQNLCSMISNGWIAPDSSDMESWDQACQAYRDSQRYKEAQQALAHAEGQI